MRHRQHAEPVPRRPEPAPLPRHPYAGVSNHALARLLARKAMDAAEWEQAATGSGGVAPLYEDVATEIGSQRDAISDTSAAMPATVNASRRPDVLASSPHAQLPRAMLANATVW